MAKLERKIYGLPHVWLTRLAAPESAWPNIPELRKSWFWFTDKAQYVWAEYRYNLTVSDWPSLALRP